MTLCVSQFSSIKVKVTCMIILKYLGSQESQAKIREARCGRVNACSFNVGDSHCCCHPKQRLSSTILRLCRLEPEVEPTELKSRQRQNGAPFWSFWEGVYFLAFSSSSKSPTPAPLAPSLSSEPAPPSESFPVVSLTPWLGKSPSLFKDSCD